MGGPVLFQSIAGCHTAGSIRCRGHYLGTAAGSITLVALVSLLLAESMPDWGRDVFYGCAILAILLLYGREKREA
jgi:ribose transport system permease protein